MTLPELTHYQSEGDTCRFIYKLNNNYNVVTVENYSGMKDFLRYSTAIHVDRDANIYETLSTLVMNRPRPVTA